MHDGVALGQFVLPIAGLSRIASYHGHVLADTLPGIRLPRQQGNIIATALKLANEHVAAQGYTAITVTAEDCQFCHQEPVVMFSEQQQKEFRQSGGFIVSLSA